MISFPTIKYFVYVLISNYAHAHTAHSLCVYPRTSELENPTENPRWKATTRSSRV